MAGSGKFAAVVGVIVIVLLVIGALNWGWLGLTGYNPIGELNDATFQNEYLERTVYVLVGIAGLIAVFGLVAGFVKRRELAAMASETYAY